MILRYFQYMEYLLLITLVMCAGRIIANFILLSNKPLTVLKRKLTKAKLFPINLTPEDIEIIKNINENDEYRKRNGAIILELNKETGDNFNIDEKLSSIFKKLNLIGEPDACVTENMIYHFHKHGIAAAINYYEGGNFIIQIAMLNLILYIAAHNLNISLRILIQKYTK